MSNGKSYYNLESIMRNEKVYFNLTVLIILFFIAYNSFIALSSLEGSAKNRTGNSSLPYLNEKPLTEDGFYLLTVAWHIASGKGIVYNYNIKTTGVQPLATFLYALPAFLVQQINGSKYLFARLIIIVSTLLQVLFAYLIYKTAISISKSPDSALYLLLSVLIVLLNFKVFLIFANGLETGLYVVLLSLFFLCWLKFKGSINELKRVVCIGFLTGLLVLCRLDAVVILSIFYIALLIKKKIRFTQLAQIIGIAFLIYLPWQFYVLSVTQNIFQSSVRSQTNLFNIPGDGYFILQYVSGVIQHFVPFIYTGNIRLLLIVIVGIPVIAALIIYLIKEHSLLINDAAKYLLTIGFISVIALVIIYFFFSTAPYFYFRYTSVIMVISFPVLVVIFAYIVNKLHKTIRVALLISCFFVFIAESVLYFHSGKSALAFSVRSEYVKNNFSDNMRVASFQSGILGYYNENVFNLDGKMDNKALLNLRNGTMDKYIDSLNVDVLIDWDDIIDNVFQKNYMNNNWEIYSKDIGDGRTACYVRKNE